MLSSHLLPDLERICDHLIVIADSATRSCGGIDELLATHKRLRGGDGAPTGSPASTGWSPRARTAREISLVVELNGPVLDPAWEVEDIGLEDIVLAYLAPDRDGVTVGWPGSEVLMTWLLWRQHRGQAVGHRRPPRRLFAVVVVDHRRAHGGHLRAVPRACDGSNICIPGRLFSGDGAIIDIVHLTIAVPLVLGVFLGATLIARETENATNVLVWTQT